MKKYTPLIDLTLIFWERKRNFSNKKHFFFLSIRFKRIFHFLDRFILKLFDLKEEKESLFLINPVPRPYFRDSEDSRDWCSVHNSASEDIPFDPHPRCTRVVQRCTKLATSLVGGCYNTFPWGWLGKKRVAAVSRGRRWRILRRGNGVTWRICGRGWETCMALHHRRFFFNVSLSLSLSAKFKSDPFLNRNNKPRFLPF